MKTTVTLKGNAAEASNLALAVYVAQAVLAGWNLDRPGRAAVMRAAGYHPDPDERAAVERRLDDLAIELPPVGIHVGHVQLELPEAAAADARDATRYRNLIAARQKLPTPADPAPMQQALRDAIARHSPALADTPGAPLDATGYRDKLGELTGEPTPEEAEAYEAAQAADRDRQEAARAHVHALTGVTSEEAEAIDAALAETETDAADVTFDPATASWGTVTAAVVEGVGLFVDDEAAGAVLPAAPPEAIAQDTDSGENGPG